MFQGSFNKRSIYSLKHHTGWTDQKLLILFSILLINSFKLKYFSLKRLIYFCSNYQSSKSILRMKSCRCFYLLLTSNHLHKKMPFDGQSWCNQPHFLKRNCGGGRWRHCQDSTGKNPAHLWEPEILTGFPEWSLVEQGKNELKSTDLQINNC